MKVHRLVFTPQRKDLTFRDTFVSIRRTPCRVQWPHSPTLRNTETNIHSLSLRSLDVSSLASVLGEAEQYHIGLKEVRIGPQI